MNQSIVNVEKQSPFHMYSLTIKKSFKRDGWRWMEREVGGGIGMGNTCKSMADSFQCMKKPTTIKKKKEKKIQTTI